MIGGLLSSLDDLDRSLSARMLARPTGGLARAGLVVLHRISQTGSYGVGWIVALAAVAALLDDLVVGLVAAGCVVGTLGINSVVKLLVRRPRPAESPLGHQPTTYSMPSAHTAMAVVGAAVMTRLEPSLAPLWWGWAAVLAASRVMLGMHYLGDVLVGAALGALVAVCAALPLVAAIGG